jgi:hypothetical protein
LLGLTLQTHNYSSLQKPLLNRKTIQEVPPSGLSVGVGASYALLIANDASEFCSLLQCP